MNQAKVIKNQDYNDLLKELKSIITNGKHQAYKAVDNIKVQTYWQIGERVVREEIKYKDRAEYGKYLVNNLAVDLEVGRRLMYRIVKLYRLYPIVVSLMPQLSWTHYYQLLDIENDEERRFETY